MLRDNAFVFTLEPKKVYYLGDLDISSQLTLSHLGFSPEQVQVYLKDFPNLPQEFTTIKPAQKKILPPN